MSGKAAGSAPVKTLGVLTSGGDCAGLNAVLRAVAHRAIAGYGWRVIGIQDGTLGLIERPLRWCEFQLDQLDDRWLREGGTLLGTTNRGNPLRYPQPDGGFADRTPEFAAGIRELGLDALIVVGGDGSMRILTQLCAQAGIGMVGVPKTIDNDVPGTEYAVGFATAITVVTEALDRLQPTAASHHRVMILEGMGRDAGHLALAGGIAGGADAILIPELPYTLDACTAHLRQVLARRRSHALLVVAEGARTPAGELVTSGGRHGGIGHYLVDEIERRTGVESRVTVLGYLQRGGAPSPRDRLLASSFGVRAVDLVAQGRFDRMVAWRDRGIVDVPLSEVIGGPRCVAADDQLLATARGLGIYVGDGEAQGPA